MNTKDHSTWNTVAYGHSLLTKHRCLRSSLAETFSYFSRGKFIKNTKNNKNKKTKKKPIRFTKFPFIFFSSSNMGLKVYFIFHFF